MVAEHGLDTPAVVDALRRAGIGRTSGAAAPGSARLHGFAVVEGAFHVDCNVAADRPSEAALIAGAVAAFPSAQGFALVRFAKAVALPAEAERPAVPEYVRGREAWQEHVEAVAYPAGPVTSGGRAFASVRATVAAWRQQLGLAGAVLRWQAPPLLAEAIARGQWTAEVRAFRGSSSPACLGSAGLLQKDGHRHAEYYGPPRRVLAQFLSAIAARPRLVPELPTLPADSLAIAAVAEAPTRRRAWATQATLRTRRRFTFEFQFVLDCVAATWRSRTLRDVSGQGEDWLRAALGPAYPALAARRERSGFKWPGRSLLQEARTRLDMACMLYNRRLHAASREQPLRELMLDSSPKVGREVFGVHETVLVLQHPAQPPQLRSRCVGVLGLAHRHTTAPDKALALAYLLWREYGPTLPCVRRMTESVRGVTTDLGVEFSIGDAGDFVAHLFGQDGEVARGARAFPGALKLVGWSHVIHGVVEYTITTSFAWYSRWLSRAKPLQEFFSDLGYVEALGRRLDEVGEGRLKQALRGLPPRFLQWRWGSVVASAQALLARRLALVTAWAPGVCEGKSEMIGAAAFAATASAESRLFWLQTGALVSVLGPLERLRQWGQGCMCHSGKNVDCSLKGRRLPQAWPAVERVAGHLVALADRELQAEAFAEDAGLLGDVVTAARVAQARLLFKFEHLNELPYSLARMRTPSVAAACVEAFDAARAAGHAVDHPVVLRFLSPEGDLRRDVEVWCGGGLLSERLSTAIWEYEWLKLDESQVEGIHRDYSYEKTRSHSVSLPVVSATLRREECLQVWRDVRGEGPAAIRRFRAAWRRWKLLAVPPAEARAGLRVPKPVRALRPRVAVRRIYGVDARSAFSWRHLAGLFKERGRHIPLEDAQWLVADYVRKTLRAGCVYSVRRSVDELPLTALLATPGRSIVAAEAAAPPLPDAASSEDRVFFLVTDLAPRSRKRPRSIGAADSPVPALITMLGEWVPERTAESVALFAAGPPGMQDLLALAPWAAWRDTLVKWVAPQVSDVDGCHVYRRAGERVTWDAEPDSLALPGSVVWDRLAARGWRAGRQAAAPHTDSMDKLLCLPGSLSQSVAYGRCLLVLDGLRAVGLERLECAQLASYYEAALRCRAKDRVRPGLSAAAYREMLRDSVAGAGTTQALEDVREPVVPPPLPVEPEPLPLPAPSAAEDAGELVHITAISHRRQRTAPYAVRAEVSAAVEAPAAQAPPGLPERWVPVWALLRAANLPAHVEGGA